MNWDNFYYNLRTAFYSDSPTYDAMYIVATFFLAIFLKLIFIGIYSDAIISFFEILASFLLIFIAFTQVPQKITGWAFVVNIYLYLGTLIWIRYDVYILAPVIPVVIFITWVSLMLNIVYGNEKPKRNKKAKHQKAQA